MKLFKEYKMKCGDIIIFNGISMYEDEFRRPIDIYTSSQYDGQWNKKGRYMSNVLFLENKESNMDIEL